MNARKSQRAVDADLQAKIKKMNWVDSMMYDHFNATLWKQIESEVGFKEELQQFRERKAQLSGQCASTATWPEDHHRQV